MAHTGPPSLGLFLLEPQRALLEGMAIAPARHLLRRAPKGNGQPVLVLPGFMADDASTQILRNYLKEQGFAPHPWLQGRNYGPKNGTREGIGDRLEELHLRYGRKVSIVGWSLGGVYAREIAKRAPDRVRQVISLGSPFGDIARPSNVTRMYDFVSSGARPGGEGAKQEPQANASGPSRDSRAAFAERIRRTPPPSVPSTAIYSKTDGVVHWQSCLEDETAHSESIEVPGSHCGLGHNPLVLYLVAERLSQREGRWRAFDFTGWHRMAFR